VIAIAEVIVATAAMFALDGANSLPGERPLTMTHTPPVHRDNGETGAVDGNHKGDQHRRYGEDRVGELDDHRSPIGNDWEIFVAKRL
jgi:hypothetical protein